MLHIFFKHLITNTLIIKIKDIKMGKNVWHKTPLHTKPSTFIIAIQEWPALYFSFCVFPKTHPDMKWAKKTFKHNQINVYVRSVQELINHKQYNVSLRVNIKSQQTFTYQI